MLAADKEEIKYLEEKSILEINSLNNLEKINSFKKKYLTEKNSIIPSIIKNISNLQKDEKIEIGRLINQWKKNLLEKLELINRKIKTEKSSNKSINTQLEGKRIVVGNPHPIRKMTNNIYDFFISQGYQIYEGTEIDEEEYNFERLGIKTDHPARSSQDTFYIKDFPSMLLRTHTSNCQSRILENNKNKNIKVISIGKVYRRDDDDTTHSHQYTNFEAIVLGENINLINLKGTLELFFRQIFNDEVKIRLRPSFFPFTEPSFEVDCSCSICNQNSENCSVCKNTGWIEILGAGMIHPNVLEVNGYDPKKFTGFAFGVGVERIIMIKYGIKDIRDFYSNDLRFIKQTNW